MKARNCLVAVCCLGIFLGGCTAVPEKDELASLEQTLDLALTHKAPVVTVPKKSTRILPNPAQSPAPMVSNAPDPAALNLAVQKSQEEFERKLEDRTDGYEKAFKEQLGKVNGKAEDALRGVERIETRKPVQQVVEKPSSSWSLSTILLWAAVIMLIADRLRQWWRCRQSIDIPEMDIDKTESELAIPDPPDEPEVDVAILPSPPDEPPAEEIPLPEANTPDDVAVEAAPPVRPVLLTPPPPQRGVPPTMKPMLPRRPITQSNEEGGIEQ